jgi:hypothetical protein
MNEEILGGLKLAIERGSLPDEAAQSFINAGYNPAEVREAAASISYKTAPVPIQPLIPEKPSQIPPKAGSKLVSMIIVILVLIAIAIFGLIFRVQIAGWFS